MLNLLENKFVKLRAVEPEDLELLYKWENNTQIWQVSNTLSPYSKFILKQYIENSHKDIYETKQLRLIIDSKENRKAIGTIDLFDIDFYNLKAGIGILIAENEYRQKGYAGITLQLIQNYVFDYLGLNQLYCEIDENNKSSLNLFQKFNFKISGKFLNWKKTSSGFENVFFLQNINQ